MPKPDRNYLSFANESGVKLVGKTIDPALDGDHSRYDDILKFSNVDGAAVYECDITGGELSDEDGVDINNRSSDICISKTKVEAGKLYAFTIKGGSSNIQLIDVVITKPGKIVDIDIGNHSDQSYEQTTGVVIDNVRRADGKPVRIRIGRATNPTITNSNVEVLKFQSMLLKAYVFLKHHFKFIP